MPSQPTTIKSKLEGYSLKALISGSQIITLGFPPNLGNLASISPKVRATDSLPGNTLKGP